MARAGETATPWIWEKQSLSVQHLTKSLMCYVSGDDLELTRVEFLSSVVARIQSDLEHGDQ